tara:strand:- start:87 stop:707 length:621 start_codon:yes stop_codon:yes gene_type:complete
MKYRKIIGIGDSHCGNFNGIRDNITDLQLGPITLYQIAKNNRENIRRDIPFLFNSNIKEKINTEDVLLLYCAGEIDIRCNWDKQINKLGKNEDELIKKLIDEVFITLLPLHKPFGFQSIVPAVRKEHILIEDDTYPTNGPNEDRVRWVIKTNSYLKQKCIENNCVFLDIWESYADEEGHMRLELSDGGVHVLNKSLVIEQIIKQNL